LTLRLDFILFKKIKIFPSSAWIWYWRGRI